MKCIVEKQLNDKTRMFSQSKSFLNESIVVRKTDLQFDRECTVTAHDISGEFTELHFQINGYSKTSIEGNEVKMPPNSQSVFFVNNNHQNEHQLYKNNALPFSFIEIKLRESALNKIISEDLQSKFSFFLKQHHHNTSYINSIRSITPDMTAAMWSIFNNPFKDSMEASFVEAKITELLLFQAESHKTVQCHNLKKSDIDKLMATKEYIENNYQERIRISDLVQLVGTNQQMLKRGFKMLFGTTIFDYYNDLRMKYARHSLLNKKKLIAEIADDIGYKNPQHFTVAFKKKFGILPSKLRN